MPIYFQVLVEYFCLALLSFLWGIAIVLFPLMFIPLFLPIFAELWCVPIGLAYVWVMPYLLGHKVTVHTALPKFFAHFFTYFSFVIGFRFVHYLVDYKTLRYLTFAANDCIDPYLVLPAGIIMLISAAIYVSKASQNSPENEDLPQN